MAFIKCGRGKSSCWRRLLIPLWRGVSWQAHSPHVSILLKVHTGWAGQDPMGAAISTSEAQFYEFEPKHWRIICKVLLETVLFACHHDFTRILRQYCCSTLIGQDTVNLQYIMKANSCRGRIWSSCWFANCNGTYSIDRKSCISEELWVSWPTLT